MAARLQDNCCQSIMLTVLYIVASLLPRWTHADGAHIYVVYICGGECCIGERRRSSYGAVLDPWGHRQVTTGEAGVATVIASDGCTGHVDRDGVLWYAHSGNNAPAPHSAGAQPLFVAQLVARACLGSHGDHWLFVGGRFMALVFSMGCS